MLKIITGEFRARKIKTPDIADEKSPVRPTKGLVRQAMFNILFARTDFTDIEVLDLFSGSGCAGLECISRGTPHVTFVETRPEYVKENIADFKLEVGRYTVLAQDALKVHPAVKADVIFADPPYGQELIHKLLERKDELGKPGTLWMLEFERGFMIEVDETKFDTLKLKRFGKSMIALLEQK
jgi:16S rRNA (guanine(966)-N(2))-methyltransferase RsmD